MSVDAILLQIDNLSLAERAELFAKLREKYNTPDSDATQTGVYKIEEIIDRARRAH